MGEIEIFNYTAHTFLLMKKHTCNSSKVAYLSLYLACVVLNLVFIAQIGKVKNLKHGLTPGCSENFCA